MPKKTDHEQLPKEPKDLKQLNDELLMSIFSNSNDINSQGAFETLYQRHKGPLYRFIKRSINNSQDANELFQDLWFKIIKNKANYDAKQKFTTWAYMIARRLMIDQFRKAAKSTTQIDSKQDLAIISETPLKQPDNEFETKQMAKRLALAVLELPLAQRQTFILHHDSGLTLQEISNISDQAHEKTKSQYRYAVQKLKLALEQFK